MRGRAQVAQNAVPLVSVRGAGSVLCATPTEVAKSITSKAESRKHVQLLRLFEVRRRP